MTTGPGEKETNMKVLMTGLILARGVSAEMRKQENRDTSLFS